jgi:hypothetical protein
VLRFINTATNPMSDPGRRCASGTPPSAVPPVFPTVGVPRQREARTGAPPRRGTPFVARRAVNLHGCAPAFRAPFPQIPAFEARCIRPGIVPLPRRTAVGTPRSGASPEAAHRLSRCAASSGTEPWRPASLCPPFFLLRGYPGSAKLVLGRPPPAATPPDPLGATPYLKTQQSDAGPPSASGEITG